MRKVFFLGVSLFMVLVVLLPISVAMGAKEKNVLIIHSYHPGFPWTVREEKGIREVLGVLENVHIFVEFMDTKRFPPTPEYQRMLFELYKFKYGNKRLDVVIVTDNNALDFAVEYHNRLFKGVPLVFCGVNNFNRGMLRGDPLVTGVPETDSTLATLTLALDLHKNAKRIYVILDDNTVTAEKNRQMIVDAAGWLGVSDKTVFVRSKYLSQVLEQVKKIPPDAVVIAGSLQFKGQEGISLPMLESLKKVCDLSKAPVYSMWDYLLGHGIVGGCMVSGLEQGREAGTMALEILNGKPCSSIPIGQGTYTRYMFDYRQLNRFGIPLSALPKGSIVLNRPKSLYQEHKQAVWVAMAILVVLLGLIALLAVVVSKVRAANQRLEESESRFRALVEKSLAGIYVFGVEDGRYLYVNRAAAGIVGYEPEEIVGGMRLADLVHPQDLYLAEEKIQGLLDGVREWDRVVLRLLTKDGRARYADCSGVLVNYRGVLAVMGTVLDITPQLELQRDQSRRMEEMRVLHEVGIMLASSRTLTDAMNRVLPAIHNHTKASLVVLFLEGEGGLTAKFFKIEGELVCSHVTVGLGECLCGAALAGNAPRFCSDMQEDPRLRSSHCGEMGIRSFAALPVVRGDVRIGVLGLGWREVVSFEPMGSFLESLAGELALGIEMVLLLEREREHAQELEEQVVLRTRELNKKVEELEVLAGRLEETNKELEAFVYSVSHDLRAPLRAMEGFAMAFEEDFGRGLPPLARDYVERIVAAARRMDRLIEDLLRYTRVAKGELKLGEVNMDEVVKGVIEGLGEELAKRGAQVKVEYPLGWVQGNKTVLEQVVSNLLGNAIKFVEKGVKPMVRIFAERRNGRLRFWFEDNGIGIEERHTHRIFRIFERLHGIEAYPGTGIGLAIVKRGVERMGGSVGVESAPGKGSRFWFELQVEE